RRSAFGGRYADHVEAGRDPVAEGAHEVSRRRTRAQAQLHAILDLGKSRQRRTTLLIVDRHRGPQMPAMSMYFRSTNSSMPWLEPSRPRPDSLTPPKGATSVEIMPSLMPTMPYSSASPTRQQRPRSRL